MCGIVGIVRLNEKARPATTEQIAGMVAAIRHRGPDAADTLVLQNGHGFGHARLSVIDPVAASNQPFVSHDGRFTLVYNGEIFNYIELRKDLQAKGVIFRTQSDTEVLLEAYREWGPDCVGRFNGMWAFGIHDCQDDSVFCSRDRFGIKPFVYGLHGSRFLFASEAKGILAAESEFRVPNSRSLSLLLRSSVSGYNSETCFEGIDRLLPAHNLFIREGKVAVSRYWDYPESHVEIQSDTECHDRFSEILSDAIRIRLRSDVPIGLTLSGGLDSSAIACLTKRHHSAPLHTFTAAYSNYPQWDESPRARMLADDLGYPSTRVTLESSEFITNVRRAVFHLESPHHSIAILPYWNIIRRAREDVTVLLEGQGADELLGGYVSVTAMDALKDDVRQFRPAQAVRRLHAGFSGKLGFSGRRFGMELVRSACPDLHRSYRRWRGDEQVYLGALRGGDDSLPVRTVHSKCDAVTSSLRRQHERGLQNLLLYGDAISMAHGLESRLPFMDYRLVEFCFALPGRFKLHNGLGKAILRNTSRGVVPDYILDDPRKLGFVSPVAEWLREDPGPVMDVFSSQRCRERGIFDCDRILTMVKRHHSGQANLFSNIYRWLMTELWFQEFIDGH